MTRTSVFSIAGRSATLLFLFTVLLPWQSGCDRGTGAISDISAGAVQGHQEPVGQGKQERVFAEAEMAIGRILLHFDRDNVANLFPVFRDFAQSLAPDTRILVAVGVADDLEAARFVLQHAGFEPARCQFLVCGRPLTAWARDRLIALGNPTDRVYFRPVRGPIPDDYVGDLELADVLARTQGGRVLSGIYLEGGNLLAGGCRVFVGRNVLSDNEALGDETTIRGELRHLLGSDPLVLGERTRELPHEHLDMYMTIVDSRTVLLGDPSAGAEFVRHARSLGIAGAVVPALGELSAEAQSDQVATFEAIRTQLVRAGFRVERIPIVFGENGSLLTWNNALVERREDGRRAYVPRYGVPMLDAQAQKVFGRLGFKTFPIDVSGIATLGGTVRCVTNVIDWRPPAAR